jgi:hypothetical protein
VTATRDEARTHFAEKLIAARRRARDLPEGPVRSALSEDFFAKVEKRLAGDVSEWSSWPPLFIYAGGERGEHLVELDNALKVVIEHTREERRPGVDRWLRADESDRGTREWRGGLFELAMKCRFLAGATDVEFDAPLPNGRDVDIRATVAGRSVCFEATVITESDEDQGVWSRFMATKATDPHAVLLRPGKHDEPDAKGPSPYYDCARVYLKAFDKLAKGWDPSKPQMSEINPNVLLLSIWTSYGMPYASSPGIGWALDELFADQPNAGAIRESARPGLTDISLATFLGEVAPTNAHDLIQSPRLLSALATFTQASPNGGRLNYNARQENLLSHAEMAAIDGILSLPVPWF